MSQPEPPPLPLPAGGPVGFAVAGTWHETLVAPVEDWHHGEMIAHVPVPPSPSPQAVPMLPSVQVAAGAATIVGQASQR